MKSILRPLRLMAALAVALTSTAAWPGGTAVTNGQVYNSPVGFSVSFGAPLSLVVLSKVAFQINNEKLVRAPETPSRISFVVNQKTVSSAEEIERLLQREFPGKTILPVKQPGALGYYWEEQGRDSLTAHYDLLTSNGDFVEISVNANSAGDGISWIAPIVRSLTYDVTPPVVLGVRADAPVWMAGSPHKLFFKITDDYSGIDQLSSLRFDQIGNDGKDVEGGQSFFVNEPVISEGGDWYSVNFTVNPFLPEGVYVLRTIYAVDHAGNNLSFVADTQNPAIEYKAYPQPYAGPRVAVLKVLVRNPAGKTDTQGPVFQGFRPVTKSYPAGSLARLFFKITDDESGVDLNPSWSCIGQFVSGSKEQGRGFEMYGNCKFRSEGGDWYSTELNIPANQPAGKYVLNHIRLGDKAGNSYTHFFSRGEVARDPALSGLLWVEITNDGAQDTAPPQLLDWRLDSKIWKAGEKQIVHVRVADDLAGLYAISGLYFSGPDGTDGTSLRAYAFDLKGKADDWYAVEFKVDPFAKAGTYRLSGLSITDRVKNESNIRCEGDGCIVDAKTSLPLAPLEITLVR